MTERAKVKNEEGRTLKAGGIVLRKDAGGISVLLIFRPKHGDYQFPKGHVDPGETPEHAALREVKEECGIECAITKPLPPLEYITNKDEPVYCYMYAMAPTTTKTLVDTDEHPEWIQIDTVVEALSHQNLKDYFSSIQAFLD